MENLRNPVRFSHAVHSAGTEYSNFVEISPHPVLLRAITETLESATPARPVRVLGTVNRDDPETLTFHSQLATIRPPADVRARTTTTADVDAGRVQLVDLPPTPWLHTDYWMPSGSNRREFTGSHPLLGMHVELPVGGGHAWQSDVGTEAHPWLADHKVYGLPVMPGAGFAEIALAAGCEALELPARSVEVDRLEVEQMLTLDGQTRLTTQLSDNGDGTGRVEIYSRSAAGAGIGMRSPG